MSLCGRCISRLSGGLIVPLQSSCFFFFSSPLEALDVLLRTADREREKEAGQQSLTKKSWSVVRSNETLVILESSFSPVSALTWTDQDLIHRVGHVGIGKPGPGSAAWLLHSAHTELAASPGLATSCVIRSQAPSAVTPTRTLSSN